MTLAYATELTLEQYELFESLLSPVAKSGRPRSVNNHAGAASDPVCPDQCCGWRLLPNEYLPYSTVYYYFRK